MEIDKFEQQLDRDLSFHQLKTWIIEALSEQLGGVKEDEIVGIEVLKKGMTNRSFLFSCRGVRYIMRIPGEGTERLINRRQEAAVYTAINGFGLCDNPIYINPRNGYKITRYIERVRCCDPNDMNAVRQCMRKLKYFHNLGLEVGHEFDIFGMINIYESLWNEKGSAYRDYNQTKSSVFSLRGFIEKNVQKRVLTHIDAIPDNFLFDPIIQGELSIQLTDWEYAGMQDPHVDIAMFCLYSLYNKHQVDQLIHIYFEEACPNAIRVKIYCYIAVCGLLWSNWCEYKRGFGVEFGEYSLYQYRFAKDYYKIAIEEIRRFGF